MAAPPSSPEDRLPAFAIGGMLRVAVGIVAILLFSMEALARLAGYHGLPEDDPALWALARSRIRMNDPAQVVFLGSSRAQLGLETTSFAEAFGGAPPVQLAIISSSPLPVLEDLARLEEFRGIAICEALAPAIFRVDQGIVRSPAEECVRFYERRSADALLERRLKLAVEQSFACLNGRFDPISAIRTLAGRGGPPPPNVVFRADRCRLVDFHAARGQRRELGVNVYHDPVPWPPDRLGECLNEIEAAVSSIQSHGGRVVFVVMPVTGALREYEEKLFPREKYWDVFAGSTKALAINSSDLPALSGFTTGDGSHLDYRDARVFSAALGTILRERLASGDQNRK